MSEPQTNKYSHSHSHTHAQNNANANLPEQRDKPLGCQAYEAGGELLQNFAPVNQIGQHVCGMHFYAHDGTRVVPAHHYCAHVTEDMHQCVIYDSAEKNAKLIGVEYIITKRMYDALPPDEKKYWHSHTYEVKSGSLFMPFLSTIPQAVADRVEYKEMQHLVNTYGKTWHLWQVDRGDQLPMGPAQLMMAFTEDFPLPTQHIKRIEKEHGIDVGRKAQYRKDIQFEPPDPNANVWRRGRSIQTVMQEMAFKRT